MSTLQTKTDMKDYILGSHNSWSYLPPRHWWQRLIAFTSRCQEVDLVKQYEDYGVRCFDLRLRFDKNGYLSVAHGMVTYDISEIRLLRQLSWLNSKNDVFVRVIHEARTKSQYDAGHEAFFLYCESLTKMYTNIRFWCGRNLYDWRYDYNFSLSSRSAEPTCTERYASVTRPRLIDDWWPWLYALIHNHEIRTVGTCDDILLIDYVNIT